MIARLPVVVLNIHSRCNCRCTMCDIWKVSESREMPLPFVEELARSFAGLSVETVALTGGEPLMHTRVFDICAVLRRQGVRVMLLTSGLLVERFAAEIARSVDELIVSLDGPRAVHDRIRGVAGGFDLIGRGLGAVRRRQPGFRAGARCTVQKQNHGCLCETVDAARELGFGSISFLAVDLHSAAFNRARPLDGEQRSCFALGRAEIETLEREVSRLIAAGDPMLADSPDHLRRIVHRFRGYAGLEGHRAPRCNAPWTSAVVEVDGTVRPCFFHPPVGRSEGDLISILNSAPAEQFRSSLNVAQNPVCRTCTCSMYRAA